MAKKTKEKTKPQKPPKEPKQKKTKDARYSKRRKGLFFALLATLLIAVSVVGACTVFFQVETVTVTGNERYSEQQILDVASVEMGANMILTPSEQIAQRIYDGLPYIHEVQVHKRFPTTIRLEITECQPAAVITGAASAWLVDANGKLLEAARDLGCNSFSVLKRVVLPLSLPGIISGITMVLIPSISTFYISQKLGSGKFFLIGDAIEGQYVANNLHFAAAIAFILMLILLAGMALMKYFTTKHVYGGK